MYIEIQVKEMYEMLSRNCDGCSRMLVECKRRFKLVSVGEKVYCPDGTAHLIDS